MTTTVKGVCAAAVGNLKKKPYEYIVNFYWNCWTVQCLTQIYSVFSQYL